MAQKWHKINNTKIEYEEHPDRFHGGHKDRRYRIRFQHNGVTYTSSFGWASKRTNLLDLVKKKERTYLDNADKNDGSPRSKKEEKSQAESARQKDKAESITLNEYWQETFMPYLVKKCTPGAISNRRQHFEYWISPICGNIPVKDLSDQDLEDVLTALGEGIPLVDFKFLPGHPRSATLEHKVWQTFKKLMTFIYKKDYAIFPQKDDRPYDIFEDVEHRYPNGPMKRALTPVELETLLDTMKNAKRYHRSVTDAAWFITFFCARTGVRFSEAAALHERHIDLASDVKTVHIDHGKTEAAVRDITLPDDLVKLLQDRLTGRRNAHVFLRNGEAWEQPPRAFNRAVDAMHLNEDVKKHEVISFKVLRRTFATRLLHLPGYSRRDVMTVMGWNTAAMAEHYDQGDKVAQANAAQAVADMHKAVDPDSSLVVANITEEKKLNFGIL